MQKLSRMVWKSEKMRMLDAGTALWSCNLQSHGRKPYASEIMSRPEMAMELVRLALLAEMVVQGSKEAEPSGSGTYSQSSAPGPLHWLHNNETPTPEEAAHPG